MSGIMCGWRTRIEYSIESTLKEARPKEIQTIENLKGHWLGSISVGTSRRIGYTQHV